MYFSIPGDHKSADKRKRERETAAGKASPRDITTISAC